jgi:hypothetical protein
MRGPSTADCEKSFYRTGIPTANMLRQGLSKPRSTSGNSVPLIQIRPLQLQPVQLQASELQSVELQSVAVTAA